MRLIDADDLPTLATELRLNNGKTKHFVGVEFDDIRNAPTIEAEPVRHGKWVKVYGDHLSMGHRPWSVCCSECDKYGDYTNYCPNCGAKMDGGTDDETD